MTRALLTLARDGIDDRELAERLCRACVQGLDIDGAAISVLTAADARQTVWASDSIAALVEELQFTLNEGACVQAAASGAPVLVPDLYDSAEVARWPLFANAVTERTPVRALFAFPLQWGAVNLGVLDLYRGSPGGLSTHQWRDALSAVATATTMLLGLYTHPDGAELEWLDAASGNRAEVHQATGMVLAQLGVSAQEALARLRAYAFTEQRMLTDVAGDVVARRLTFTEDMR